MTESTSAYCDLTSNIVCQHQCHYNFEERQNPKSEMGQFNLSLSFSRASLLYLDHHICEKNDKWQHTTSYLGKYSWIHFFIGRFSGSKSVWAKTIDHNVIVVVSDSAAFCPTSTNFQAWFHKMALSWLGLGVAMYVQPATSDSPSALQGCTTGPRQAGSGRAAEKMGWCLPYPALAHLK